MGGFSHEAVLPHLRRCSTGSITVATRLTPSQMSYQCPECITCDKTEQMVRGQLDEAASQGLGITVVLLLLATSPGLLSALSPSPRLVAHPSISGIKSCCSGSQYSWKVPILSAWICNPVNESVRHPLLKLHLFTLHNFSTLSLPKRESVIGQKTFWKAQLVDVWKAQRRKQACWGMQDLASQDWSSALASSAKPP